MSCSGLQVEKETDSEVAVTPTVLVAIWRKFEHTSVAIWPTLRVEMMESSGAHCKDGLAWEPRTSKKTYKKKNSSMMSACEEKNKVEKAIRDKDRL